MFLAFFAWCLAWAGTVRVDVLDVGQGDSILIRTPAQKTILIDAGDGKTDVVQLLRDEKVDHLDLVIATHPHADHIGGMQKVVQALPPKLYTDNGLPHTTQTYRNLMATIESENVPYRAAEVGQVYNLDDGAKLEVLNPGTVILHDTRSDLNSNSVVTRLTHGQDCFLFVGDSEEPTEQLLLQGGLGQCDVLKVAHHGSRHSSTQPFLDAVKPKIALISVGMPNRYRHPGQETLDRLHAMGTAVYRTDLEGQLTVLSSGKGVEVKTAKEADADKLWVGGESTSSSGGPMTDSDSPDAPAASAPGTRFVVGAAPTRVGTGAPPSSTSSATPPAASATTPAASATTPAATPPATPPAPPTGTPTDTTSPDTAASTTAADGTTTPADACAYIASKNSEVFHEAKCGNGLKISAENKICYATREAAVASGRRPAGCCHP